MAEDGHISRTSIEVLSLLQSHQRHPLHGSANSRRAGLYQLAIQVPTSLAGGDGAQALKKQGGNLRCGT
jgi:hypothetical protein